jgi:hypothetical protein
MNLKKNLTFTILLTLITLLPISIVNSGKLPAHGDKWDKFIGPNSKENAPAQTQQGTTSTTTSASPNPKKPDDEDDCCSDRDGSGKLDYDVSDKIEFDDNKLHHIFDKSEHNLGPLLDKFGGDKKAAAEELVRAAQKYIREKGISKKEFMCGGVGKNGKREPAGVPLNIRGETVTVSGNLVNRVFRISDALIKIKLER